MTLRIYFHIWVHRFSGNSYIFIEVIIDENRYLSTYIYMYTFPFLYFNERNMEHRKVVIFYQKNNTSNDNGESLFFITMAHYINVT